MLYHRLHGNTIGAIVIAVFCTLIVISCSASGDREKTPTMEQLVPREILGWKAAPATEMYDRETIFDYIDGAGEVYLSYGFLKVAVFRYDKPGQPEITVEIFDMNSPEDAYGVFSHSRESEETGIGGGYEYRGSLLSFWKARYFICVLADKNTPEAKGAVFALAREIDGKISETGQRPALVDVLPKEGLAAGSVRFFHGAPSLNYHYFLAEGNILHLDQTTNVVMGRYNPGNVYAVLIQYPNVGQADQGYNGFLDGYVPEARGNGMAQIEQGTWVAIRQAREFVVIILDAPTEEAAQSLMQTCMESVAAYQ